MRIHTNTHTWRSIHEALDRAKAAGKVADHVEFEVCVEYRSRSKARGIEVKLGTFHKEPGDGRRWTNTGNRGANSEHNGEALYAATYDEWGWFLAEVFDTDPEATCWAYVGAAGFNASTKYAYVLGHDVVTGYPRAG
jgi:hypothetical protein